LPYNSTIGDLKEEDCKPKPRVRVTKEVARLDISAIFQIFHYILPFFKSLEFKSRKHVDFIYWEVAVRLRALGYLNNPQGGTGRNQGLCVNIYENGKLIEGSPFASCAKAALALGNVNLSSTVSRK